MVLLQRRRGGVNGIYRCEIPDAMNVNQFLYIGVYTNSTGESTLATPTRNVPVASKMQTPLYSRHVAWSPLYLHYRGSTVVSLHNFPLSKFLFLLLAPHLKYIACLVKKSYIFVTAGYCSTGL